MVMDLPNRPRPLNVRGQRQQQPANLLRPRSRKCARVAARCTCSDAGVQILRVIYGHANARRRADDYADNLPRNSSDTSDNVFMTLPRSIAGQMWELCVRTCARVIGFA